MNWRFNEPKCAQSKQESNMENPVRKALENLLAANDRVTKARASVNSNLLNSAIAGQEIAENEARSVLRFTTNVDIDKPDAWQYRCHVGGWLNWREVDEPIDQFVKRNNFNIHNGTCEIRKLYALPSEAKNKYHIKSSNNNLVIELEKYRAKYRNEWCIATPSLSWDDFNLIVTALRAVPDGAAGEPVAWRYMSADDVSIWRYSETEVLTHDEVVAQALYALPPATPPDRTKLSAWFNSLPCEALGETHWLQLLEVLSLPATPPSDERAKVIDECIELAKTCNLKFYPNNSSGNLAHQIDQCRADFIAALRALSSTDAPSKTELRQARENLLASEGVKLSEYD